MLRLLHLVGCATALLAGPLAAQEVVTSPAPDAVEISLYRDSARAPDDPIDRDWPEGFALVSETRLVTLPPGPVTLRFEGVASGIDPASALVRGVGVEEKNQDAALLGERGLLDHFTGQRVTVRRLNRATGEYSEEPALIRSGAGRVVLETPAGFEALSCSGLAQTLVYDRVPETLSAKPTLSVNIADQPGGRYRVTLIYLADRFDWQANYVAELNLDASAVALRGWITLVSADATSINDADTNAIAGQVYRSEPEGGGRYGNREPNVSYACWPSGTTGAFEGYDQPREVAPTFAPPSLAVPAPPPPPAPAMMDAATIIVTGSRIAKREDLGDLKLYRIPFPTTVAANAQKQVAFLDRPEVKGELLYHVAVYGGSVEVIERIFRIQNTAAAGLGEPLPSGQVALFQSAAGLRQLVGEAAIADKATGEEIELALGGVAGVIAETEYGNRSGEDWDEVVLTVHNANPVPAMIEAELTSNDDQTVRRLNRRTFERDGKQVWRLTIPANGTEELRYRLYKAG